MVITEQSEVEEVRDCGRECNDMGGSGRQKKIVQEAEKDEESWEKGTEKQTEGWRTGNTTCIVSSMIPLWGTWK